MLDGQQCNRCVCSPSLPAGVATEVRHRGIGIPPRERKQIFQRFVRGEHSTRLGIKGAGLGLAMVVPAAGGQPQAVAPATAPKSFGHHIEWSPGGESIALRKSDGVGQGGGIFIVPVNGGEARRLDLGIRFAGDFRFHPDGRQFSFSAGLDKKEVWVMENFLSGLQPSR